MNNIKRKIVSNKFEIELELLNESLEFENFSAVFERIIDYSLGELKQNKQFVIANFITLLFLSIKNSKIGNEVVKLSMRPHFYQRFSNDFDEIFNVLNNIINKKFFFF